MAHTRYWHLSHPLSLSLWCPSLVIMQCIVIVSLPALVSTARSKSQETGFSYGPPRPLPAACAGPDNSQGRPGDIQGAEKGARGPCFPSCVTMVRAKCGFNINLRLRGAREVTMCAVTSQLLQWPALNIGQQKRCYPKHFFHFRNL